LETLRRGKWALNGIFEIAERYLSAPECIEPGTP